MDVSLSQFLDDDYFTNGMFGTITEEPPHNMFQTRQEATLDMLAESMRRNFQTVVRPEEYLVFVDEDLPRRESITIIDLFEQILMHSKTPEIITKLKFKNTYSTSLKITDLNIMIHFLLTSVLRDLTLSSGPPIVLTKQNIVEITRLVRDRFNVEEENKLIETLCRDGIMSGIQKGIDNAYAITETPQIKIIPQWDPHSLVKLESDGLPTIRDTEWAREVRNCASVPRLRDEKETIGGKTFALLIIWDCSQSYAPWVLKPSIQQRSMEEVTVENVYQLLNRVISLLSKRSELKLEQPQIHNLASWLCKTIPDRLKESHKNLVKTSFGQKIPTRTLDRWMKRSREAAEESLKAKRAPIIIPDE